MPNKGEQQVSFICIYIYIQIYILASVHFFRFPHYIYFDAVTVNTLLSLAYCIFSIVLSVSYTIHCQQLFKSHSERGSCQFMTASASFQAQKETRSSGAEEMTLLAGTMSVFLFSLKHFTCLSGSFHKPQAVMKAVRWYLPETVLVFKHNFHGSSYCNSAT